MHLLELWKGDNNLSFELYKSFEQNENGFVNPCFQMNKEEYDEYVKLCFHHSFGLDLKEGYVPDTKYIVVNDENEYVGIVNFRHYLNNVLENGAGHIGYGIAKKYRGRGYGNKALALVLEKCKEIKIKEVYLSCLKDNEASYKVQLANGAFIHHEDDDHYYTRILLNE